MNLVVIFGYEKIFQRTQETFYWPGMSRDITDWVNSCEKSIAKRNPSQKHKTKTYTADMEAKPSILAGNVGYHRTATGISRIQVNSSNPRSIPTVVRSGTTSKPMSKDCS